MMKTIEGGVTAPGGFLAAALNVGIRSSKPDLALLVSEREATVAAAFTTNRVQAAPVRLCKSRMAEGRARAVLINSGNANCCTGPRGETDAARMAALTAAALGVPESRIFVCSTGTIGIPLPMDKIEAGIPKVAAALRRDGGDAVARAIMTTDTVDKQVAVEIVVDGKPVRLGGMAKGSGMIEPNMATMLAFLTTDAAVDARAWQACISAAVEESFNRITIDGDQSTNDTVLALANGAAGNSPLSPAHGDWPAFELAVKHVCRELAVKIVRDGEGATKFVTIRVQGAASDADARKAAKTVANSMLCKTAWFGGDPNWGRLIAAVGRSGAAVDQALVDISFDGLSAVRGGCMAPDASLADLAAVYARKAFEIVVDLHLGFGCETVFTCDCSLDYVRINADYMT